MASVLAVIVCAPGLAFLGLSTWWFLAGAPRERVVALLTAVVATVVVVGASVLGWSLAASGRASIETGTVEWLRVGGYHIDLALVVDRLSWPLVMVTSVLVGVVSAFSLRYVHRERGFFRFFLLLHLFSCGALLVLTAGSFDLLLCGWELVGLTSVLLIAFFDERSQPVRSAIRVFGYYRFADLGLLVGLYVLHSSTHTTEMSALFIGEWPHQQLAIDAKTATALGLLLLMAAAGKSAQAPFSGWLARAMEGPTPSSAIFYGAISVHLGAYLLLRAEPLLAAAPLAAAAVVVVGALTAVLATLVHRVSSDAKTALAYAAMAQLGVIFVEIGLGWSRVATAHIVGHAVVRTLQFLRAPSMLHDYHRMHAAAGGQLQQTGLHLERVLPQSVSTWLYRLALEHVTDDALVDRLVIAPVETLARWCESLEQTNGEALGPTLSPEPQGPAVLVRRVDL